MRDRAVQERPFRHLCPEADLRDAMTDAEFWEHVFGGSPDVDDDFEQTTAQLGPCPECGEMGACAFDDQGRALIHVIPDDDEVPA